MTAGVTAVFTQSFGHLDRIPLHCKSSLFFLFFKKIDVCTMQTQLDCTASLPTELLGRCFKGFNCRTVSRQLRDASILYTTNVTIDAEQWIDIDDNHMSFPDVAASLVRKMPYLTHLTLRNWYNRLQTLDIRTFIAHTPSLLSLNMSQCNIYDLTPLAACTTTLQHLELSSCRSLTDLSDLRPLAACCRLQHLVLSDIFLLSDLGPLAGCTMLQHLQVSQCPLLIDLGPLASCAALQHLEVSMCHFVSSLQPLANCTGLQHLEVSSCYSVADLVSCTTLRHLKISDVLLVSDLGPLSSCAMLQHLEVSSCPSVSDLRPLAACTMLRHLQLVACLGVADLLPLSACTMLQNLELVLCIVRCVEPLAACTMLRRLKVALCPYVSDMGPLLAACTHLRHLDFSSCVESSLSECSTLYTLQLIYSSFHSKLRTPRPYTTLL